MAGQPVASDSGMEWLWWLVAALALAGLVVAALLWMRSRRDRREWESGYAAALRESEWLAHDLLPTLRAAATPDEQLGGWTVARPRVTALEGSLGSLLSTSSDELGSGRVTALLGAVQVLRSTMDGPAGPGAAPDAGVRDLTASSRQLDDALATVRAAPDRPDPHG